MISSFIKLIHILDGQCISSCTNMSACILEVEPVVKDPAVCDSIDSYERESDCRTWYCILYGLGLDKDIWECCVCVCVCVCVLCMSINYINRQYQTMNYEVATHTLNHTQFTVHSGIHPNHDSIFIRDDADVFAIRTNCIVPALEYYSSLIVAISKKIIISSSNSNLTD